MYHSGMRRHQNPCLQRLILESRRHFRAHGRTHLPWRRARNPYRVLVSEVMLQQTQVDRVIPFYRAFLKKFPTLQKLAQAPLSDVLGVWQGLGYNRRGKMLSDAAKKIMEEYSGRFPREVGEIEKLSGVGPYTARAVAVFAFNVPEVFIETNIRTVFLHHCFADRRRVDDKEILPLVAQALDGSKMQPRDFYSALMDYGSYLKHSGIKLNTRSSHYVKQSKFEGSRRQLRGKIFRLLLQKPYTASALAYECGWELREVQKELLRLQEEGLVVLGKRKLLSLSD